MSSAHELVKALKKELKASGMTYADLAEQLGMAESSMKRVFGRGDMTLSRIDEVLRALKMDFADLARKVTEAQPLARELTLEQEKAVVADRKLLLLAVCCLSQWSMEQILASYHLTEVECIQYLAQLDRLKIIELRPMNRYRLLVAKGFRWRPYGPVAEYFRKHMADDFFSGGFGGEGETVMLVHGLVTPSSAEALTQRLKKIGQDFEQQHLAEQRLPEKRLRSYTMVVGMRSWLFEGFRDLKRKDAGD